MVIRGYLYGLGVLYVVGCTLWVGEYVFYCRHCISQSCLQYYHIMIMSVRYTVVRAVHCGPGAVHSVLNYRILFLKLQMSGNQRFELSNFIRKIADEWQPNR